MSFTGHPMSLGALSKLSNAETRSITAENIYGEKGKGGMAVPGTPQPDVEKIGQLPNDAAHAARDLGQTWKVRPCISLAADTETTLADVEGPGVMQHMWITVDNKRWRDLIFRIYWDGQEHPSVETPLGDFFCNGWPGVPVNINALPINVNNTGALNCYFPMPFRKHCRITIENRHDEEVHGFFYTFNYTLTDVADDEAYFHAQFRRTNPLPYKEDYLILDGVKGKGQYVGTSMAWQQNNSGWWGEGEFKAFIDGDEEFPTICGTGTEDYFGGAWCFAGNFSAPFLGYPRGESQKRGDRHLMYRFHVMDPIRFQSEIKVTMQALGWRKGGRYLPLQDDIASVAYWYQTLPTAPFPPLGSRDDLEVI